MTQASTTSPIPGVPTHDSLQIVRAIQARSAVQKVVLYGSRALGRQRSGSDIDLCLDAPGMGLAELLELGGELDDLLLPWRIDLQLRQRIDQPNLLAHVDRAGVVLWKRQGHGGRDQPARGC